MPYPNTDWPSSIDTSLTVFDGSDIVWADNFNYQDEQILQVQTFLGVTGDLLGDGISGGGIGGAVSPSSDGGTAFQFAARADFTAGKLVSFGDDYDNVYSEKFYVDYDGKLITSGGMDLSGSTFLLPPKASSLPGGLGAPDEGRMAYKTGADNGLYAWDGSVWNKLGGTWEGYLDGATNYAYTVAATPVEEVCGQFVFDGSKVASGLEAVFRALVTPTFATSGNANVYFYDLGPAAGPPTAPRLVTTLTTTATTLTYLEQALTIVSAGATGDEILDAPRLYEITLSISAGTTGDTIYLGSAGLNVEVA